MFEYRNPRSRILLASATVCAGAVASSAHAHTADGYAPPGSTICSQVMASSSGVYWHNHAGTSFSPWTHTLFAADTFGGTESELLQLQLGGFYEHVAAPGSGAYYYRTCVTNTSPYPHYFRLRMEPLSSSPPAPPTPGSPITAVLGPGGNIYGNVEVEGGTLVGESDVPVRFCAAEFDENYALGGFVYQEEATEIEQQLQEPEFGMIPCVYNPSEQAATLSFQFIPDE